MRLGVLIRNIVVLVVILGALAAVIGRRKDVGEKRAAGPAPPPTEQAQEPTRNIQLLGPSTVARANAAGENIWEAGIEGDWNVEEGTGRISGNGVTWRIVGRDLAGLELQAGRFEADEQSDTVRFRERVDGALETEDATFSADEAEYDPIAQRLTAAGGVAMQWRTLHVTGESLTADMVAHEIQVHGKVKITYEG